MGNFDFNCDNKILVNGQGYIVIGAIYYSNLKDQCEWVEYCISSDDTGEKKYLSIDEGYHEYALYTMEYTKDTFRSLLQKGFHEVDRGTAKVTRFWGNSDVEVGDRVQFCEYEDSTEEKIMAIERWEDETEYSTGYYLDENEIQLLSQGNSNSQWNNSPGNYNSGGTYTESNSGLFNLQKIFAIAVVLVLIGSMFIVSFGNLLGNKSIAKYLKESSNYTYATSITSNQKQSEKADVYTTSLSVDIAIKAIIDMLQGNLISVQQNTADADDNSVAILTKKEYCLVYTNTDGLTTVQISSRLYAYTSENHPYRSSAFTSRYYRRYYYSNAYSSDNRSYKKYNSSYSSFDDSALTNNTNDPYSTYSNSVRQSSTSSRSSSGGGTSSGK